jgi:hypothetical protein
MTTPSKNFTMTMPDPLKANLEKYSNDTGVPIGEVLRRLAEDFFAKRIKTNSLPAIRP